MEFRKCSTKPCPLDKSGQKIDLHRLHNGLSEDDLLLVMACCHNCLDFPHLKIWAWRKLAKNNPTDSALLFIAEKYPKFSHRAGKILFSRPLKMWQLENLAELAWDNSVREKALRCLEFIRTIDALESKQEIMVV